MLETELILDPNHAGDRPDGGSEPESDIGVRIAASRAREKPSRHGKERIWERQALGKAIALRSYRQVEASEFEETTKIKMQEEL
jgi:hypothetical protein